MLLAAGPYAMPVGDLAAMHAEAREGHETRSIPAVSLDQLLTLAQRLLAERTGQP